VAGRVVVVTDSTAYLPDGLADRLSIRVVPLRVVLGGRSGEEGTDVTPADIASALSDWVPVSTSRPTPAELAAVYRAELAAGAAGVVSLHLSRELSGTWDSARIAAEALLGTALSVKPILHVHEGRILPLEKVRTASKGVARLEALAVATAGDRPVDIAVHHLAAPYRAAARTERLRARLPRLRDLHSSEVGAVVGAHVGPGVLGVVIVRG